MFNKEQFIEQITNQTKDLLKNNPFKDFEENFKAILHSIFEKFDLVSREEFDIQQRILADTRAKLEQLEQQIQQINSKA